MDEKTKNKSYDELAQDMCTREDSLTHLTAKAEMARRAASQARWNGWCMLASVIIAMIAAIAAAVSAYLVYLNMIPR
jgi:hypothetical protein